MPEKRCRILDKLRTIERKVLEHFDLHKAKTYVVEQSVPFFFLGDLDAYRKSHIKILTVGKNPSINEFKKADPFENFPGWNKADLITASKQYFKINPYKKWFNTFDPILKSLNASFYEGRPNTVLHTNVCTPLTTEPTWSKLRPTDKDELSKVGIELWKETIEALEPDIILMSVRENIVKSLCNNFKPILTITKTKDGRPRKENYIVEEGTYKLPKCKFTLIYFGKSKQRPFDSISNETKEKIGKTILNQWKKMYKKEYAEV